MNVTVLVVAIISAAFGAHVTYLVGKRQWWPASGLAAFGVGAVLNMVTLGNHSRSEHKAVFAAGMVLLAYYMITLALDRRAKRASVKTALNPRTDRVTK